MKKFEIGKTYTNSSICDHNSFTTIEVISRTEKTIKAIIDGKEIKTFRPYEFEGKEQIKPYGNYSMCMVISADHIK